MKYTFSRFTRWNKWHIHSKSLNFLFIINNFKRDNFCTKWRHTFLHIMSYKWWRCIKCNVGQNWNHRRRSRESENFIESWHINYQNLTKKMNTHTLCFCPLKRKLQAFEILKWAQGSQWRKKRTSNFTREIQLIFLRLWNTAFYISTAVKYSFLKYALYLIKIFLYFITLYIIKAYICDTSTIVNSIDMCNCNTYRQHNGENTI